MSAIASFYVVPAERLTECRRRGNDGSRRLVSPARDTFRDVLRGSGPRTGVICLVRLGVQHPVSRKPARPRVREFRRRRDQPAVVEARGSDWLVLPAASSQLAVLYCLMSQRSLIAVAQDAQRDHRGP
jgi:hypothetical protein